MRNMPSKGRLDQIPRLHETEGTPLEDKLVYLHFFVRGFNLYVFEFDGEDCFRGCAIWHSYVDFDMHFSFDRLKDFKTDDNSEVDCESADKWVIRKVSEIEEIKKHL